MPIRRKTVISLSFLTLFGFSAIGLMMVHYLLDDQTVLSVFERGRVWQKQLLIGGAYGLFAALAAYILINHPFLKEVKNFFIDFTEQLQLTKKDMIWFSICAGIGEEILFRAAIQQFIGIWPTACLFIVLHGYLNPYHLKMTLYGVVMIIVSAGLGYLYEFAGLYAAVFAHFTFDALLFMSIR